MSCTFAAAMGLAGLALHHWDASRFVTAGAEVTDAARAPAGLHVAAGTGYDGQYFYRLALDPLTGRRTDYGITLDDPAYRQQRILYPALAWLVSRGRPSGVPGALLAINVAALAALGIAGGALAVALGRHRLWGLALPLYPGFTMSLFRDLAEILAALLLVCALVGLRRRRWLVAAICMTAAVLTRETTIVLPVAGLACLAGRRLARPDAEPPPPPAREWLAFAAPLVAFAAWEVVLRVRWGTFPLNSGRGSAALPLVAATRQVASGLSHHSGSSLRLVVEILAVLGILVWLATRVPRAALRPYEVGGFVVYVALAAVLARDVWAEDWSFVRVLAEAMVLGVAVVLSGPRREGRWLVVAGGALWLLTAASIAAT